MRNKVNDNMYNIGSHIRNARKRADLTQEELSESIGVTPQYLSDLERGLVGTSISTLIKICNRLNVSADYILFGSTSETNAASATLIEKFQRLPAENATIVLNGLNLLLEALDMEPEQRSK